MLKEALIQSYVDNLQKVISEIEQYKNEEDLWKLDEGISNSGGNLALHLIGNINHFFGTNLAGTGYVRERDLEFSGKGISRDEIIKDLENAKNVLRDSLENLSEEAFQEKYPEEIFGGSHSIFTISIYMLTHLNYHLGQINYHRRLLSK